MTGKAYVPASVIAARGKKITLIDGSTPTLLYGFSSIMRLEEDFGSVGAALQALQPKGAIVRDEITGDVVMTAELDDDGQPVLDATGEEVLVPKREAAMPSMIAVAKIMCAGLEHESIDRSAEGGPSGLLSDSNVLRHLLDSQEIEQYVTAVGEAFEAAFPQGESEGGESDPTTGAAGSLGQSGTTSQPSSFTDPNLSSGA